MVEILVVTYLGLGLIAALLIWTALLASKRHTDEVKKMPKPSFSTGRVFEPKAKEIKVLLR